MTFVPVGPRILVKAEILTKIGSILVPEAHTAREFTFGEVVAVGSDPECEKFRKTKVFFYLVPAVKVSSGGEQYLVVDLKHVLGIVSDDGDELSVAA